MKRTATGLVVTSLLLVMFQTVDAAAETPPNTVSTDPPREERPSVALMASGISLTAVGALGLTAGFGIGFAALHFWEEAGWGKSDSAAMLGFPSLTIIAFSAVFVAAGIPMLVIGKRKRDRFKSLSVLVPTPNVTGFIENTSTRSFHLQWAFAF